MSNAVPFTLVAEKADLDLFGFLSPNEEDCRRRYDAFIAGLDEKRRDALRHAKDFFSWLCEMNSTLRSVKYLDEGSFELDNVCREVMYFAKKALGALRRFGMERGCRDFAEAGEKLDGLVRYARSKGWEVAPEWWLNVPNKNTAYFISRIKDYAGRYDGWMRESARQADEMRQERLVKRRMSEEKRAEARKTLLASSKGGAR